MKQGKPYKKGLTAKWVIPTMLVISFLMFIFLLDFQAQTKAEVDRQMKIHLQEITRQASEAIRMQLQQNVRDVQNLAIMLESSNIDLDEGVLPLLRRAVENSSISRLALVTAGGRVLNSSDLAVTAATYRYGDAVFRGESGISDLFVSGATGEDVLSVYWPIWKNKQIAAGVFGTLIVDELYSMVEFSGFEGAGFAQLIQSDGSTLLWTTQQDPQYAHMNFFELLNMDSCQATLSGGKLSERIRQGQSGHFSYSLSKEGRNAYYTPVGFKDWYLISVVPKGVLDHESHILYSFAVALTCKVLAVCVLVALFVFLWSRATRRKLLFAHEQAVSSNHKYEIAMKHTKYEMFEYDLADKSVSGASSALCNMLALERSHDSEKFHFDGAVFTPHSFLGLQRLLEHAQSDGQAEEELEKTDGTWLKLSLSNVSQSNGMHLIGTAEDITHLKKMQDHYLHELEYCAGMLNHAITGFSVDLEDGRLLSFFRNGVDSSAEIEGKYLSEHLVQAMCAIVHPDDRKKMIRMYGLTELKRIHLRGVREITEHFLLAISDPEAYEWACATVHLLTNPTNGHALAFSYVMIVEEDVQRELELERQSQRDGLTGVLNRVTFVKKVNLALQSMQSHQCRALLMMDLDGFKAINDESGHQTGDRLLCALATILSQSVNEEQAVGRLGGDEFVLFLNNATSRKEVLSTANDICRRVEGISMENVKASIFTISIGVAFAAPGDSFDDLYRRADELLYRAKREGKNRVYAEDRCSDFQPLETRSSQSEGSNYLHA